MQEVLQLKMNKLFIPVRSLQEGIFVAIKLKGEIKCLGRLKLE